MRIHFLFFIFYVFSVSVINANTDKFYSSANGLSNSHTNKIYQDKTGQIWICTDNGLNVFDGINFRSFYNIPGDTTSLLNNSVLSILEDSKGNIWVGTSTGLQRFDREIEKFVNIHFSYPYVTDFSYISCIIEDRKGNIWLSTNRAGAICLKAGSYSPTYYMKTTSNICSNTINVIYEDRFNNIWFGSQDNGVSILSVQNQIISNYSYEADNDRSLSSNSIFSIIENSDGNILIGTIDKGIDVYDYTSQKFRREYIPSINNVFTMCNDKKENLWIGTDGGGLKYYNYENKSLTTYETLITDFDLRSSKVHSILEDRQGNIWLAIYQKGVLMISPQNQFFRNMGFNPFNEHRNIGTECILSICKDNKGDTWIGTDGDGIYRLNSDYMVVEHYSGNRMSGSSVLCIYEDSKNRIWAGTYLHGLFLYNPQKDAFEKKNLETEEHSVKHINVITEDKNGMLWIGTNENGLCVYDPSNGSIKNIQYNLLKTENQILGNTIHTVLFGKNNLVWIGTSVNGLSCFDLVNNTFTDYTQANGKLSNNNIYSVAEDKDGNLWVGTKSGLNFIDIESGKTIVLTETDGLSNSSVYGIEIDQNNNLWISTGKGLSNYNIEKKSFTNYYVNDGLLNDEFRRGAHFQSKNGELFFGSINGISFFTPSFTQENNSLLSLIFTNLLIYNEDVKINDDNNPILKKSINYSNDIVLSHSIKSFTIGFAGLEYNNPGNVVYQIRMDGFDNEWKTLPRNTQYATYTNLPPGEYLFKVRGRLPNSEYVERSLKVLITPPVWQTWWARVIYLIVVIAVILYIYKNVRNRIRSKQNEIKRLNETQIMQSKLQFFTDVSHEIRTPLTLILTPIEHLIGTTTDEKVKKTYKLIIQNGQRILSLINQIMEMRKLDRGQVRLRAKQLNIIDVIRDIMVSFDYLAVEKNIDFSLETEENLPKMWIDKEKIDKVLFNVLSNAFKYTGQDGKIGIKISTTSTNLRISVLDTGPGISRDFREAIFNRFYQIPDENNKNKIGTGIGLHLSRSLMEIHHGEIYVDDSPVGSKFVITLPLDDSYLSADDKMIDTESVEETTTIQPYEIQTAIADETEAGNNARHLKHKNKLLIVEDDKDIRNYIRQILSEKYNILEADNGNTGLELVMKELPDCVVTDLSMSGMDGLELCKKIKNNKNTCHIPVIMLTARTTNEQRLEGLQMGADSYIPKPFKMEYLMTRISKLIELRNLMKDKYQGKYEIDEDTVRIKTSNEKFIQKLEDIVKEQMANPDLSVETISRDIGMSRSQLQRKLKQLMQQNPSEYIKTTRLRHAAWLLESKDLAISEIAYATGFSSLSHFSNSFKEYYGISPSQYMEVNNPNKE